MKYCRYFRGNKINISDKVLHITFLKHGGEHVNSVSILMAPNCVAIT